jgi:hypothetical protein
VIEWFAVRPLPPPPSLPSPNLVQGDAAAAAAGEAMKGSLLTWVNAWSTTGDTSSLDKVSLSGAQQVFALVLQARPPPPHTHNLGSSVPQQQHIA